MPCHAMRSLPFVVDMPGGASAVAGDTGVVKIGQEARNPGTRPMEFGPSAGVNAATIRCKINVILPTLVPTPGEEEGLETRGGCTSHVAVYPSRRV